MKIITRLVVQMTDKIGEYLPVSEESYSWFGRVAHAIRARYNTDAAVASVVAQTAVAVTDSLNGATFTGTALLTSATPTVDELEAIAGMLGLITTANRTDILNIKAELAALRTKLGM